MMNHGKSRKKVPPTVSPRKKRMVCLMSEEEVQIVERYLEQYQIKNKARWLRETVLTFIRQNMEDDYPTLFKEHDMRRYYRLYMADDNFYMKQALMEARAAASAGEVPVGAVVVCRDRIVARGHNLTETLNDVTAHAEMQAITAAANTLGGKYLTDCTLYVTVEPCVMCAGAIAWAQMGRLVYGAADEKRGFMKYASGALHPKTVVVQGVLADECASLMKEFFKSKR